VPEGCLLQKLFNDVREFVQNPDVQEWLNGPSIEEIIIEHQRKELNNAIDYTSLTNNYDNVKKELYEYETKTKE
jgi:hypothetical protein